MEAKELLKAVMNGFIEVEQSGYAHGDAIVEAGPYRYFGANSSGIGIKSDKDYIYYYGVQGEKPIGMPESNFTLPIDDVDCVYLWEIDE